MSTEKTLQAKCIKNAKRAGWLAYKFASPARRGVPDVMFITNGAVVFVEFKHPNGKGRLSELQKVEIDRMIAHGASVYVIDSEERFNELFI